MKRMLCCVLVLCACGLSVHAQELEVLLVAKDPSAGWGGSGMGADVMGVQLDLPQALAVMAGPSGFSRKLFSRTVTLQSDTKLAWAGTEKRIVDTVAGYQVLAYRVSLSGAVALPAASKRVTVSFTLAQLVASSMPYNPAYYGLKAGILKAGWRSGRAWVESIRYEGGRFTAVIALAKGG